MVTMKLLRLSFRLTILSLPLALLALPPMQAQAQRMGTAVYPEPLGLNFEMSERKIRSTLEKVASGSLTERSAGEGKEFVLNAEFEGYPTQEIVVRLTRRGSLIFVAAKLDLDPTAVGGATKIWREITQKLEALYGPPTSTRNSAEDEGTASLYANWGFKNETEIILALEDPEGPAPTFTWLYMAGERLIPRRRR